VVVKIQKWGNSLALRIPKAFTREINIEDGSKVNLVLEDGKLMIIPMDLNHYKLSELLLQIHENNLHGEVDTKGPVGKESW
jgi:antitoxin MazE